MRKHALISTAIVLAAGAAATLGQQPDDVRFMAELSGNKDGVQGPLTLDVTFYSAQTSPEQAEKVVRHCLDAAIILDGTRKIEAKAWRSVSSTSTDRQPLTLASGSNLMAYEPKGESSSTPVAAAGKGTADAEEGDLSAITGDREVKRACKGVDPEHIATLVKISAENSGAERKIIVKALRTWTKDNNVSVDRGLRSCMSAISKAASAAGGGGGIKVEDLQASIANGTNAFNIGECAKCHRAGAKGGPRGPDLTDKVWAHCDGTIEGIHKILLSGIPQNKMKDTSRTFGMDPATNLIQDGKSVTDLAIYIHSLSQN